MDVLKFDPSEGVARQGDVVIMQLPAAFKIDRTRPKVAHRDGALILAEGEATGHHHSILAHMFDPLRFRDDAVASLAESKFTSSVGTATLHEDRLLALDLHVNGYLLPDALRLCVGFLTVDDAPVTLRHQEHAPISIPPGEYYVGRQQSLTQDQVLSRVVD